MQDPIILQQTTKSATVPQGGKLLDRFRSLLMDKGYAPVMVEQHAAWARWYILFHGTRHPQSRTPHRPVVRIERVRAGDDGPTGVATNRLVLRVVGHLPENELLAPTMRAGRGGRLQRASFFVHGWPPA